MKLHSFATTFVGLASLALAVPTSAQLTHPCLSDFQSVEIPSPQTGTRNLLAVRVSGDHALATTRDFPPIRTALFALRRDALSGLWSFRAEIDVVGAMHGQETLALDGEIAAIAVARSGTFGVAVLRFDAAVDAWVETQFIPFAGQIERVELVEDTLAVSTDFVREEIHLFRIDDDRRLIPEITFRQPDPQVSWFSLEFSLVPGRLISSHLNRFDVFERNAAGVWGEVATLPFSQDVAWISSVPQVAAHGDRVLLECRDVPGGQAGYGFWRYASGLAGPSVAFDGGVFEQEVGAPFERRFLAFAEGTALMDLEGPGCGGIDPARRTMVVLDVGAADRWSVGGQFCDFAGFTSAARVRTIDYDGRTLAVAAQGAIGQPMNTIQFASLLGADLDRDRSCTEDAQEIALQPSLDRNVNGVLDAFEERGTSECSPSGPNSTGLPASLRLIGPEFVGTTETTAVASGLPPGALTFLAVARSPLPGTPSGALGLCIGSGAAGGLGRYPAALADATGVALIDVKPTATPLGGGTIEAFRGETWGWQLIYRDGPDVRLSNSIRVLLE